MPRSLLVLWLLACVLSSGTGQARGCPSLQALSELEEEERRALESVCRSEEDPDGRVPQAISRLKDAPFWQATLLLTQLPSQAFAEKASASVALKSLEEDLKSDTPRCSVLSKQIDQDAQARPGTGKSFGALDVRKAFATRGCMEANRLMLGDLAKLTFAIVVSESSEPPRIAVWPPSIGGTALAPYVVLVDVGIERAGFYYWFTVVPRGARIRGVAQSAGDEVQPQVFDLTASRDFVTQPPADANHCLELEVIADNALVLLDGIEVQQERRRPGGKLYWARRFVRTQRHGRSVVHAVTVVDRPTGKILGELAVPRSALTTEACTRRRLDLRRTNVSALIVSQDAACDEQGVVRAVLRRYVRDKLETDLGAEEKLVDFEAWATALGAISELHVSLSSAGSEVVGGDRGRLGAIENLRLASGELMRRGFQRAFVAHLSCSSRPGEGSYSFLVHQLDLRELQEMDRSRLAGMDEVEGALDTYEHTVTHRSDLRDLVDATLARRQKRAHARLVTPKRAPRLHGRPHQWVEAWRPDDTPTSVQMRVLRMKESSRASALCAGVEERRRLATAESFERPPGDTAEVANISVPAKTTKERFPLPLPKSELYLVELVVDGVVLSYRCVEAVESDMFVWSLTGFSPALLNPRPELDRETTQYSSILLGFALRQPNGMAVSPLIGYGHLYRLTYTSPTWNDVLPPFVSEAPEFSDAGTTRLSWNRRAMLMGVGLDWDIRMGCAVHRWLKRGKGLYCSDRARRWGLLARLMLAVDVGMIDTEDIPAEYYDFRAGREPNAQLLDVDLIGGLYAGSRVRTTERLDLYLLANLSVLGLDDAVRLNRSKEYKGEVSYDFLWMLGISAGMGWGL